MYLSRALSPAVCACVSMCVIVCVPLSLALHLARFLSVSVSLALCLYLCLSVSGSTYVSLPTLSLTPMFPRSLTVLSEALPDHRNTQLVPYRDIESAPICTVMADWRCV